MANDFPRMVMLLRKERGLSQKQVALDLNISQALLSHYEKGIRECGLDFMVKIADYFNVSCDYLLGRTSERSIGGYSYTAPTAVSAPEAKNEEKRSSVVIDHNKKLISDSLEIVFRLLEQADHKGLTAEVSSYLMVTVYKLIRAIYSTNPKNPQAMFSVIPELYKGVSTALQSVVEANINCIASGKTAGDFRGIDSGAAPSLSPDIISKTYPELAHSLYALIREVESNMKKLI